MKEGWTYKKLGELYPIIMGKTPPRNVSRFWDTKKETHNLWVSIADLSKNEGKEIFDTKEYISDEATSNIIRVSKGSLLVSFKLTLGKMAFAGDDLYTNEAIMSLDKREDLDLKFLYYYFSSLDWGLLAAGNEKVKGKTLNKKSLGEIPVAILSKADQLRIVSRLDSAFSQIDELKANAEKQLSEAKALFQASLKEMLEPKEGWEEKSLKEISYIQSGFPFKSSQFVKEGQYQVIRMGNVRNGLIRYNEAPVFVNQIDNSIKEKAMLQLGDMIITQTGSRNKRDYGFTVLIEKEGLLLNQRIARIRVKDTISNKFLLYYSWTDYFRDQYFANEGGTVGQGNVGIDAIKEAIICYPPAKGQQEIVESLDTLSSQVRNLEENCRKTLAECDALKQAMLREVFE